jgi:hypothetical protein
MHFLNEIAKKGEKDRAISSNCNFSKKIAIRRAQSGEKVRESDLFFDKFGRFRENRIKMSEKPKKDRTKHEIV